MLPRNAPWMLIALICGCCCLNAYASPAEQSISELPIGYLHIAKCDGGAFHIQARCVPARGLIEATAKALSLSVVFDEPVRHYVTVDKRITGGSPQKTMAHMIRITGMGFREEETVWHVCGLPLRPARSLAVDNTLTETELESKYGKAISPKAAAAGITGGAVLVADGHLIAPPYTVEGQDVGNSEYKLLVNGVVVQRVEDPDTQAVKISPQPTSGQYPDRDSLRRHVTHELYPRLLAEFGDTEARNKVLEFLKSQKIVEAVVDADCREIKVRFSGQKYPAQVFPSNFDFERGQVLGGPPPPTGEMHRNLVAQWERRLALPGNVVMCCPDSVVELRREVFLRVLKTLSENTTLSVAQRICIWAEVTDRVHASFLAVNFAPHPLASLKEGSNDDQK